MKLKAWIGCYLAVTIVAILGLCFDFFSYPYIILLALLLWGGPLVVADWNLRRFRKGRT
jgi:hypothetical protein